MSRLYPCAYCTEDGYCMKYSDDEVTSWCVQGPCKDEKPSKADRIRSMSDEELAEFLRELTDCVRCTAWDKEKHGDVWNQRPCYTGEIPCKEMWIRWMKQEASE